MRPLIFLFLLLSIPAPLRADESIRVALADRAPQALFTAKEGFLIKTSSGENVMKQPVASAEIGIRKGLTINGRESLQKELLIVPRGKGRVAFNKRVYNGAFRVKQKKEGLLVINEVDLEHYLEGVVPAEMSPDWEFEALKVQAVISRTYALYQMHENAGREYDLVSTVLSQVYQGTQVEALRASAAVAETRGLALIYQGAPALTFFHSTSAGPTEDAAERWNIDLPYLKGVSCPLDRDSPYHEWKRTISLETLEGSLRKIGYDIGAVATLTPLQWSRAGRLLFVRILHAGGELILKGEELRKAVGYRTLPSTNFRIVSFGKEIELTGMGYGHGVGLCQWGAKVMAEQGLKFEEILLYYFPGVELRPYEESRSSP